VLAVASIGVFVAFVDATVVNIAFPSLERSFPSAGASGVSWVLNAYNVTFAAFLVAGGRIADVFGRRRLFSLALVLFTVGSELCAAAPTLPLLVAARVVQAVGAALMIPSSLGLVLAAFPSHSRSHAVALLTAVGAAAAGVGPSLGGLLISAGSWRLVFLVNAPIGLIGWLLASRKLVESRAPGRRGVPDIPGAVLFAAGAALVLLGIVQGHSWGWAGGRVLASFVIGLALLCAFGWRCAHHRDPLLDPELMRVRSFRVANLMTIVAASGYYGYTLCNVLFLTTIWHYSILATGLALTPGPIVAVVVAATSSRIAEKLGPRAVVVPGGLVWGGAVLWMVYRVGSHPDFLGQWLPGMVLLGIGAGLVFSNLSSTAVATAPSRSFATASALNSVARQLGAAVGVAVTVTIIGTPAPAGRFAAFHHAWMFGAACLGLSGVGFAFLGRLPAGTDDSPGTLPSLGASTKTVLSAGALSPPAPAARVDPISAALVAVPHPVRAETVSDFLSRVPIFAGLSADLLGMLAARSRSRDLAAGEWLLRAGDHGDAMYVVRAGRLEVVHESEPLQVIGEVGRGGAVGELALITGEPRAASVRAARHTELIAIERVAFDDLLGRSAEFAGSISRVLALQLRASRPTDTARPLPSTIAIVTLGMAAPATAFAHELGAALERDASVSLLDGAGASQRGTQDDLAHYGPLLDLCEREDDRVLLLGGNALSGDSWTNFCLQQADRILLLTSGGPIPTGLERHPELSGCDLVAWGVKPGSGALAGWAEALSPVETHAFPDGIGSAAQFARTARRLNGRAVGLVLSGGGARSLAHLGVIEELTASGIIIDRVAGVSMGAYIGALLACGLGPAEIDARCYEEFVRHRPFGDYALPRSSLIRGDRFVSLLERSFGELTVEELERSFLCTSTDLRSSKSVVLRRGPLVDVVAASMCLPVLAAPLVSGRSLLIDGSLTDNLPVVPMADLGEGPIIAVDVKASLSRPADKRVEADPVGAARGGLSAGLTSSQRLRQRWAGGGRSTPPYLSETLARLFLLASSRTSDAAAQADLVIAPRNPGLGLLEFHQIDAAREAGRRAAQEALEQAPRALFP
jgi:EmrB/QacA subfamily drug resistance transporter